MGTPQLFRASSDCSPRRSAAREHLTRILGLHLHGAASRLLPGAGPSTHQYTRKRQSSSRLTRSGEVNGSHQHLCGQVRPRNHRWRCGRLRGPRGPGAGFACSDQRDPDRSSWPRVFIHWRSRCRQDVDRADFIQGIELPAGANHIALPRLRYLPEHCWR